MWEIEVTDQFGDWFQELAIRQQRAVAIAVEALAEIGPGLGRPTVDTISRSRHANMKELRPRGGNLRVLFAFDPRRTAILLLDGDKTGPMAVLVQRGNTSARRPLRRASRHAES